jgi:hypothetical protein
MDNLMPMKLVDLEMAARVKQISREILFDPDGREVVREVLATVAEYLTHRSNGDDDAARHDLKYVTMVVGFL